MLKTDYNDSQEVINEMTTTNGTLIVDKLQLAN
jgi:hypothetical protein